MSLFWRIFSMNAAVLVVAAVLLLGPWVTVSSPVVLREALVVIAGVLCMLVANGLLLRVGLAPLQRLSRAMASADLLRPGGRPEVTGHGEVAELIETFNTMLERLETERATSSARVVSAQEAERHRVARELHDEVGQTLTAVLLQLKRLADTAPDELRDGLRTAQETTRDSLDEIRRIARRLRPGVLDDLGLVSALRALLDEFAAPGITVRHHFGPGLPPLGHEAELAVYRVAQEGLTNAVRHADASRIELWLRRAADGDAELVEVVELVIEDDGHGLRGADEGFGMRGMRERALLVGARFLVESGAGRAKSTDGAGGTDGRDGTGGADGTGGTTVRLLVPVERESR
ncbi:HAMP domain-containing sensor histidine kinase [Streptomyces yaizuensis]|uniref:histidine kinase n=1 Tax=Streptomyces yaizuensis TaxID=2989713 RepID=A0ABQ5NX40_9ACTN|nr:HAMP domain-containing sensor histidine kinase [Streptomyces sp. YSPA8]GLF94921.1 sensor histidine kinase [Streptomyces sp. YSPA8]